MNVKPIKLLLIEDNIGDSAIIRKMLEESENTTFEITHAPRLKNGLTSGNRKVRYNSFGFGFTR